MREYMRAKQQLTKAAIGELVTEFQTKASALLDEEPGRAQGYAEAALVLAYAFDAEAACLPRGEAIAACPVCRQGRQRGALRGALIALYRFLTPWVRR